MDDQQQKQDEKQENIEEKKQEQEHKEKPVFIKTYTICFSLD